MIKQFLILALFILHVPEDKEKGLQNQSGPICSQSGFVFHGLLLKATEFIDLHVHICIRQ